MRKDFLFVIYLVLVFFSALGLILFLQKKTSKIYSPQAVKKQWSIRSIDTMKYSRDLARQTLFDESFDTIIDKQIANIARTGANYVAIGTPYDEEFYPILRRWVGAARKYKLKVWFRGNFSGWEEWFDYPKIDIPTHILMTKKFILDNKDLFNDGDIFTSCPECENGTKIEWGDERSLDRHRAFLIVEYDVAKDAFSEIRKNVSTGYYSMNGDLAAVLMDRYTTAHLGGIVVVDHYVDTPEKLARDISDLVARSGGKIVLGEVGAPVPDIHGEMSDKEQERWIRQAFEEIAEIPELIGVNYWVNKGGSTALWDVHGSERSAVKTIRDFYLSK